MGEIFHGQTKGYMFACDQLHVINITLQNGHDNKFVIYFTQLSKIKSYYGLNGHIMTSNTMIKVTLQI